MTKEKFERVRRMGLLSSVSVGAIARIMWLNPPAQAPRHDIRNEMRNDAGNAGRMRAESLVLNNEIFIYGVVDPWEVRAIDVITALAELRHLDTITVRINSPGGSVYEGLAIYDALRMSGRRIIVRVDALAGSIASIIAMAGDELVMAEDARLMIHNPWSYAQGESDDLRRLADELDSMRDRLIEIYQRRATNLTREALLAYMDAETFFTAQEAVEAGLATRVDEPVRANAITADAIQNRSVDYFLAKPSTTAAEPAPNANEEEMLRNQTPAPAPTPAPQNQAPTPSPAPAPAPTPQNAPQPTPAPAPTPAPQNAPAPVDIAAQARAQVAEIYNACAVLGAEAHTRAADMVNRGLTPDQARAEVIRALTDRQPTPQSQHITITADGRDRFVEGARRALMARARLEGGESNEFSGLNLRELARECVRIRNVTPGRTPLEVVGQAFTLFNTAIPGMHTTSDFGIILGDVAQASMLRGFNELPETWAEWTSRGTATDFRPQQRVDIGMFPALEKVEEAGEYTYGTMGDRNVWVMIATYGKMFAISRQAIINDNINAFTQVPRKMGQAARRTVGNLVYAVLTGNPVLEDGVPLFHATHGNLLAGAAPSIDSLLAMRNAMARQKDPDNVTAALGITPGFVITPPELEAQASGVLSQAYDNRTPEAAQAQVGNPVRNMARVVSDARLTGTAWYGAANPNTVDTLEVTYLDGNETPFLDQQTGWHVDGTEFKVRIDAGVNPLDFRGLSKNPGQ